MLTLAHDIGFEEVLELFLDLEGDLILALVPHFHQQHHQVLPYIKLLVLVRGIFLYVLPDWVVF
jgi:hypothetical protein